MTSVASSVPAIVDLTRRAQVYALWNSSLDWIGSRMPGVSGDRMAGDVTWTGAVVQRSATPGEAAGAYESCPACGGDGKRRVRRIVQTCDRCAGRGRISVDPQTRREVAPAEDLPLLEHIRADFELLNRDPSLRGVLRAARRADQDAEIERLGRQLATSDDDVDWWLSRAALRKQRLWSRGSYRELAAAMGELQAAYPLRHGLVTMAEVHQEPIYISDRTRALIDATADWVAARMPSPIRVPAEYAPATVNAAAKRSLWHGRTDRHQLAREARRERVVHAHLEWGWTPEQIASHESLSVRRVRQLLAEHHAQAGEAAATATGPAA